MHARKFSASVKFEVFQENASSQTCGSAVGKIEEFDSKTLEICVLLWECFISYGFFPKFAVWLLHAPCLYISIM